MTSRRHGSHVTSHLPKMKGFVEFHLLRGPEHDDHTLYASHTTWASEFGFPGLDEFGGLPRVA